METILCSEVMQLSTELCLLHNVCSFLLSVQMTTLKISIDYLYDNIYIYMRLLNANIVYWGNQFVVLHHDYGQDKLF